MDLSSAQHDRAVGALVGLAVGDALGAGYEFETPGPEEPQMVGGGGFGWGPGEWTDDTQMAVCIAKVLETGSIDVDAIGDSFLDWYRSGPKDVGNMTRSVLSRAARGADLPQAAARYFEQRPNGAAGNGSLMRTAPVALAFLDRPDAELGEMAMAVSALTHADPQAQEACAIWCVGIKYAVLDANFSGVRAALDLLPSESRERWSELLDDAEQRSPADFTGNGYVVRALQAAWSSIVHSRPDPEFPCRHLQLALNRAISIGDDTDTVGAITGMLLGARWGGSAIPALWTEKLHGWPGWNHGRLVRSAQLVARGGRPDENGWPTCESMIDHYSSVWNARGTYVQLPRDPGVVVGDALALRNPDFEAAVVVSLCRMGTADVSAGQHHVIHMIDAPGQAQNPNLDFVLKDLAESIVRWRSEGKSIFVHCVGAQSRTPTLAAAYLSERFGLPGTESLKEVRGLLPHIKPNDEFTGAVRRLWP